MRKAQAAQAHHLRNLRRQCAGQSSKSPGNGIERGQMTGNPGAQRSHPHAVLPDADAGQAEWRCHQATHQRIARHQYRQCVQISGMAGEIELEDAQQWPHFDARQAIVASRHATPLACQLLQHLRDRQADHDRGQAMAAQNQLAAQPCDQRTGGGASHQTCHRISPDAQREYPSGIGAHAKHRRMTQGHDARVAKH